MRTTGWMLIGFAALALAVLTPAVAAAYADERNGADERYAKEPQATPAEAPVFHDRVDVLDTLVNLTPIDVGDFLHVKFGVGSLEVHAADFLEVRTEVDVSCRKLTERRCEKYRRSLRLEASRDGDEVRVRFAGLPRWKMRKLQLTGRVFYPTFVPLTLEMGIGEAEVLAGTENVTVKMGIGELRVRALEENVHSVDLRVKIGDVQLLGKKRQDGRRRRLVGARTGWAEGPGNAQIRVSLGIGDATVLLD